MSYLVSISSTLPVLDVGYVNLIVVLLVEKVEQWPEVVSVVVVAIMKLAFRYSLRKKNCKLGLMRPMSLVRDGVNTT